MKIWTLTAAILITLFLGACSQQQVTRNAFIERIEVEVVSTDPARVEVTAYGLLINDCMRLSGTEQRREDSTLFVDITTAQPADETCEPVTSPFTQTTTLDTRDLSSGTYTVNVNGVTGTFTLPEPVSESSLHN